MYQVECVTPLRAPHPSMEAAVWERFHIKKDRLWHGNATHQFEKLLAIKTQL